MDSSSRSKRRNNSKPKRSQRPNPFPILRPPHTHHLLRSQRLERTWPHRALRQPHHRPSAVPVFQRSHLQRNQHWHQLRGVEKEHLPFLWWGHQPVPSGLPHSHSFRQQLLLRARGSPWPSHLRPSALQWWLSRPFGQNLQWQ